jgi:hypothetical protein
MSSWDEWELTAREISKNLSDDKIRVVEDQLEFFKSPKGIKALTLGRSFFSAVPEEVEPLIDQYVVQKIDHPTYSNVSVVSNTDDYLVESHGILDSYIGKYYTETVAAKEFLSSDIEIDSAVLVTYFSDKTRYIPPASAKYVIEHVYKGEMHVLYKNTPDYMRLGMYRPLLAHGYRPNIDGPDDVLVHKGTQVLVFTYREKE